jgi:predicted RNA-binding protein associated with RNAse of E/G family
MWSPGDVVVHQETWRGRLWAARPLVVLEDDGEQALLWMPHGAVRKVPAGLGIDPGNPRSRKDRMIEALAGDGWRHVDHAWELSTVVSVRRGDWFGVWTSWLPGGEHFGYYVNLQMPMRRTALGFESMDLMLDVIATPDLRWEWKDEDEFAGLVELGMYDAELAATVRREADRAVGMLESRTGPFDGRLTAARPEQDGPLPVLPPGWDRPAALSD